MEGRCDRAYSPGFSAATICRCHWSIWKPEAAATACIPTVPTKIAAASRWCPIFSSLAEIRNSRAISAGRAKPAALRRRRRLNDAILQRTEGTLSQVHVPEPAGALSASRSGAGDRAAVQAGDRAARSQSDRQDPRQPYRRPGSRARSREPRPANWPMCWRISRAAIATCWRRSKPAPTKWKRRCAAHAAFHEDPAPVGRRLFSQRIFVRSLGAVQSQHRAASRPVRRAERRPCASSSAFAPSAKAMCPP